MIAGRKDVSPSTEELVGPYTDPVTVEIIAMSRVENATPAPGCESPGHWQDSSGSAVPRADRTSKQPAYAPVESRPLAGRPGLDAEPGRLLIQRTARRRVQERATPRRAGSSWSGRGR